MLFSHNDDNALNSRAANNKGLNDQTMVDYTLERKGNNQATYMMDIKDQAQQHQMRFGKQKHDSVDDGGAARADSAQEKQPQDDPDSNDEQEVEKELNEEVAAAYQEQDENDLNASFEKGKGDTEGAKSSLELDPKQRAKQ